MIAENKNGKLIYKNQENKKKCKGWNISCFIEQMHIIHIEQYCHGGYELQTEYHINKSYIHSIYKTGHAKVRKSHC